MNMTRLISEEKVVLVGFSYDRGKKGVQTEDVEHADNDFKRV